MIDALLKEPNERIPQVNHTVHVKDVPSGPIVRDEPNPKLDFILGELDQING